MPLVPLRRSDEIVAYAKVDDSDLDIALGIRWFLADTGYARESAGGRRYLHRVLMQAALGPGLQVDHINRDRLDNRRANLRVVTLAQNRQNQGASGASPYRGVSFHRASGKWFAQVKVAGQRVHASYHRDEIDAARAAEAARAEHMTHATRVAIGGR